MKLKVTKMAKEEVYRGMVRIPENYRRDPKGRPIPEAAIIKIRHSGGSTLAIARGDLESSEPTIKLDDIMRQRLGIATRVGQELDFDLEKKGLLAEFCFHWSSPDPASRFAMRMAILSVMAGLLGLGVGIISFLR